MRKLGSSKEEILTAWKSLTWDPRGITIGRIVSHHDLRLACSCYSVRENGTIYRDYMERGKIPTFRTATDYEIAAIEEAISHGEFQIEIRRASNADDYPIVLVLHEADYKELV